MTSQGGKPIPEEGVDCAGCIAEGEWFNPNVYYGFQVGEICSATNATDPEAFNNITLCMNFVAAYGGCVLTSQNDFLNYDCSWNEDIYVFDSYSNGNQLSMFINFTQEAEYFMNLDYINKGDKE